MKARYAKRDLALDLVPCQLLVDIGMGHAPLNEPWHVRCSETPRPSFLSRTWDVSPARRKHSDHGFTGTGLDLTILGAALALGREPMNAQLALVDGELRRPT